MRFLLDFAPGPLTGLVFAGVLAAVMSTADSFMNVGAAALVRDLPRACRRSVRDELAWGRWATLGLTVAAAAFAWLYGDLIALLGTFAFGTFGAALAPVLAVGLNWRRVAATASIATGLGVNLCLDSLARQTFFSALPEPPLPEGVPSAVALAATFAVLCVVTWSSRERRLDEDVRAVMEV